MGTDTRINGGLFAVGYEVTVAGGVERKRRVVGEAAVGPRGKRVESEVSTTYRDAEERGKAERIAGALRGVIRDCCVSTIFGPMVDKAGRALLEKRWSEHEARAGAHNAGATWARVGSRLRFGVTEVPADEITGRAREGLAAIHAALRAGDCGAVASALQTHSNVRQLAAPGFVRGAFDAALKEAREALVTLRGDLKASGGKASGASVGADLCLGELEAAIRLVTGEENDAALCA